MTNELKNRKRFSTSIDKELAEKLKQLSDETSIPISKLIDKAITLVLEEFRAK